MCTVLLEGSSFDLDVFDNEVENSVYYDLKDAQILIMQSSPSDSCLKDMVTCPYKLRDAVQLQNGDLMENKLSNV